MGDASPPSHPVSRSTLDGRWTGLAEIGIVFASALGVISVGARFVGDNPLAGQAVAWVANVLMLVLVWIGLRLRGQGWSHLGLRFGVVDGRGLWRAVWRSLLVFVAAVAAFALGAIVVGAIVGRPQPANLSGYNYLSGNLPMLVLALISVAIVSSLGEEVLYRGFLMTRLAEIGGGGKAAWRLAVVVSSIVFGMIHYKWGLTGVIQTGSMGLALGVSYLLVKRNLWVLVLAHFYLDAILLVQMYLAPR